VNRRDTSLAVLIGVPASLAGVTAVLAQQGQPGQQAPGQALQDLKKPLVLPVTGNLMDGDKQAGTFEGELTNVQALDPAANGQQLVLTGQLTGTGTINGKPQKLDPQAVKGTLGTAPATADADVVVPAVAPLGPAAQTPAPSCPVLVLTIPQGLTLNLLGLSVVLSALSLVVAAIPGAGNLLGNLLCAVVNLLNPSVVGTVLGNALLAGVLSGLIASLNQLLGGLLAGTGA
jgi:hypothetical protein